MSWQGRFNGRLGSTKPRRKVMDQSMVRRLGPSITLRLRTKNRLTQDLRHRRRGPQNSTPDNFLQISYLPPAYVTLIGYFFVFFQELFRHGSYYNLQPTLTYQTKTKTNLKQLEQLNNKMFISTWKIKPIVGQRLHLGLPHKKRMI